MSNLSWHHESSPWALKNCQKEVAADKQTGPRCRERGRVFAAAASLTFSRPIASKPCCLYLPSIQWSNACSMFEFENFSVITGKRSWFQNSKPFWLVVAGFGDQVSTQLIVSRWPPDQDLQVDNEWSVHRCLKNLTWFGILSFPTPLYCCGFRPKSPFTNLSSVHDPILIVQSLGEISKDWNWKFPVPIFRTVFVKPSLLFGNPSTIFLESFLPPNEIQVLSLALAF